MRYDETRIILRYERFNLKFFPDLQLIAPHNLSITQKLSFSFFFLLTS